MNNILELTDDDLRSMSIEELEALLKRATDLESLWDTQQMTKKILLNSLYGALGNKYFVLFNPEIGAAITGNGRYTNKTMGYSVNDMLKTKLPLPKGKEYLIYGDTDSLYITLDAFVKAKIQKTPDMTFEETINFCDNVCEKLIQPFVNDTTAVIGNILNIHEEGPMAMDREIIADSTIFIAKKRYIARVLDTEGVRLKEPKKKVMGLEIVRSSTPKFCRKYLKESIDILLDSDEESLQDWVSDVKEKFMKAPIEDISRVTGVNKVSFDFYVKDGTRTKIVEGRKVPIFKELYPTQTPKEVGFNYFRNQLYYASPDGKAECTPIPINTRAAMVHNTGIVVKDLQKDYTLISEKDKMKYCLLNMPNFTNSDVFGYMNPSILDTLEVTNCVNKEAMWERFFIQSLDIMIEPLNWSHKKKITFDEWF